MNSRNILRTSLVIGLLVVAGFGCQQSLNRPTNQPKTESSQPTTTTVSSIKTIGENDPSLPFTLSYDATKYKVVDDRYITPIGGNIYSNFYLNWATGTSEYLETVVSMTCRANSASLQNITTKQLGGKELQYCANTYGEDLDGSWQGVSYTYQFPDQDLKTVFWINTWATEHGDYNKKGEFILDTLKWKEQFAPVNKFVPKIADKFAPDNKDAAKRGEVSLNFDMYNGMDHALTRVIGFRGYTEIFTITHATWRPNKDESDPMGKRYAYKYEFQAIGQKIPKLIYILAYSEPKFSILKSEPKKVWIKANNKTILFDEVNKTFTEVTE